jgi:hypothetical protein
MKGYNRLGDVRFALSENEIIVEVKEPNLKVAKIHRLCKTLFKEIDVE